MPNKSISKSRKGTRIEKRCADELKAEGYLTWKTIRVQYQNIDVFGLFDVLGLAEDGSHLLMIQCKSNRCDNKLRDKIRALKVPPRIKKEIWIWKDRRGWVKEYYV